MHGKRVIDATVSLESDIKQRIGYMEFARCCVNCRYHVKTSATKGRCIRNLDIGFDVEDPADTSCDKWSR